MAEKKLGGFRKTPLHSLKSKLKGASHIGRNIFTDIKSRISRFMTRHDLNRTVFTSVFQKRVDWEMNRFIGEATMLNIKCLQGLGTVTRSESNKRDSLESEFF